MLLPITSVVRVQQLVYVCPENNWN